MMDFLLIAALAFGAFMLFRMLRRGQTRAGAFGSAVPVGAAPTSAAGGYTRSSDPDLAQTGSGAGPGTNSFIPPAMGAMPPQPAGSDQLPDWFDGDSFIEGAKTHFIRLQAAWDRGDFRDIRDYTTPQLFAELQRERGHLGGTQYTEVVRLQAELLTLQREEDMAVASIRFSGLIREEEKGVAQELNEIWHIQHPWASPEGDWYIAGIQQD
jgi:predicted lipid-binding transport protein (Tim44 family)